MSSVLCDILGHMTAGGRVYVAGAVKQLQELYADLFAADDVSALSVCELLDRQALRLREAHRRRDPVSRMQISSWHPRLIGCSAETAVAALLTRDDARLTLAREHGFADWSTVERDRRESPDAAFEQAVDALLEGDADSLTALLDAKPSLIEQRSAYGHAATLLHYVGSNGVETRRQQVPRSLVSLTRLLIARGADINAGAKMYGGSTTLELVRTSAHPHAAGLQAELEELLKEHGAK